MADMDNFIALSAALTGVEAGKLAPGVDPIDVKAEYFTKAQNEGGAAFTQVLAITAANPPPAPLPDILLNQSGDDVRFLCRSITLLWFLGSWYTPADLKRYAGANPPSSPINGAVLSSKAYTQGWVWSAAQAHPMGYSNFHFGHWAAMPPLLDDFIKV